MRIVIIIAVCLFGLLALGLIALGRDTGPITPPTAENSVVVCGLEGIGPFPFATNEAGGRIPITEEACAEWQARGER